MSVEFRTIDLDIPLSCCLDRFVATWLLLFLHKSMNEWMKSINQSLPRFSQPLVSIASSSSSMKLRVAAAKESITVPLPLRSPMSASARSLTAACRTSKTARHPAMADSSTLSRVLKSGNRASHCDKTSVPLCGSMAQGRHTAFLPCCVDSSCRLRSTRVVSVMSPAYPAEQAHRMSLTGMPASIRAAEAALMAAQRRPPSSARITTCTWILDFG
mmetsp:Transcript_21359/g.46661  ORF Transcript_21359/g.46661 Transcript_21359/m.46661 type:complete len:215 (+) Transcript_21359:662-1306(+)